MKREKGFLFFCGRNPGETAEKIREEGEKCHKNREEGNLNVCSTPLLK